MCKFTNRLFIFTLLALLGAVARSSLVGAAVIRRNQQQRIAADPRSFDILAFDDYDSNNNYDMHYDQRQKGNENLRVRMDGFFIELPPSDVEEGAEDIIKEIYDDLLSSLTEGSSKRGAAGGGSRVASVRGSRTTTPPIDLTQQQQQDELVAPAAASALSEKKPNLERHADMRDAIEEALMQRDIEARNVVGANGSEGVGLLAVDREPEGRRVGKITKQHFNTLLNMLRRMRRH